MASLVLMRELKEFDRDGAFDRLAFDKEWSEVRAKFGILGRVVTGMLQGLREQRILLFEISALLFQYKECLMNL